MFTISQGKKVIEYAQKTLDCRVQSDLVPLIQTVQVHGLQWSIQKVAYFGKNFLIGYSIFGREEPFANEEQ